MDSFKDFATENRKLALLQILSGAGGYEYGEHVLRSALDSVAHKVSSARLRTDIDELAEQGQVEKSVESTVLCAKLTERGLEVAEGRAEARRRQAAPGAVTRGAESHRRPDPRGRPGSRRHPAGGRQPCQRSPGGGRVG